MSINFLEISKGNAYNFLREDKRLGENIILLTVGGSHGYGTNIASSDIDIRGCALNSRTDILGMSHFEQVTNETTDTTIYSFHKLIHLLVNCNPNTIEILGCKKEHYFYLHPIGEELLQNKKMFLSKKAIHSFAGYANQQLRRLENTLVRDSYLQIEKERHIMSACESAMRSFGDRYTKFPEGSMILKIQESKIQESKTQESKTQESKTEKLEKEIFIDANLKNYPLRDYKNILSELSKIVKDYDTLNKRNRKKDDLHLNKHAMHLIRLHLMCIDILEKEEIITFRENDIELLMDIRTGKYQKEDKSFNSEFYEMLNFFEEKMKHAMKNTSLVETPDHNKIEEFVMSVNERVVLNEY